jgi:hypothetical protein
VDSLERFATSPDAPPAWRQIATRVAAGEFSWQDVRDGHLVADATFLAALESTIRRHRVVSEVDTESSDGETAHGSVFVDAW